MPVLVSAAGKTEVRNYSQEWQCAWDAYVCQHPNATPFHLTAWKRAIEKAFGFQSRYLVAEEQGMVRGVLPLFQVRNPVMGKVLLSTPFAVYGGVCASDEEAANALRQAACRIALEENVQYLELRQQSGSGDPEFQVKQLYVAFGQELPATADRLLQGFPRDTRYMIRKAEKNGLRAVVDNSQLDSFYEIYAHSVRNLGTPVFARRFFRILLEEFREQCELSVIWHQERAVAAVLSFRFRDQILPYYGGSLWEARRLAANNFMYWDLMKRSLESGLRYFDFGRSKVGTGSYAFKTQWGMTEQALPYEFYLVRRKHMPNFSPANPRFHLAGSLWKRLPFPLTKMLGPALVRLFP
ncbi:MAG: FemAB family XrtA/PEP-CTERM system-associated protein [Chlamydiota bacterium]